MGKFRKIANLSDLWEKLKTTYGKVTYLKAATLKGQFWSIMLQPGQKIADYIRGVRTGTGQEKLDLRATRTSRRTSCKENKLDSRMVYSRIRSRLKQEYEAYAIEQRWHATWDVA